VRSAPVGRGRRTPPRLLNAGSAIPPYIDRCLPRSREREWRALLRQRRTTLGGDSPSSLFELRRGPALGTGHDGALAKSGAPPSRESSQTCTIRPDISTPRMARLSQPVFGDATPSSRSREVHATRASRLHEISGPGPPIWQYGRDGPALPAEASAKEDGPSLPQTQFSGNATPLFAASPRLKWTRLSRIHANCRSLLAGDFEVTIACKQAPSMVT